MSYIMPNISFSQTSVLMLTENLNLLLAKRFLFKHSALVPRRWRYSLQHVNTKNTGMQPGIDFHALFFDILLLA